MNAASDIIARIDDEVIRAHILHETFFRLFDSGVETANVLMESDEQFFELTYLMFLDSIALSFTRLLDPEKGSKNTNLSFFYLLKETELKLHPKSTVWLGELERIKGNAKVFRDARNKYVAHHDLQTLIKPSSLSKPGFSRTDITEVYRELTDLLSAIKAEIAMPPLIYGLGVAGYQYAQPLLLRLTTAKTAIG